MNLLGIKFKTFSHCIYSIFFRLRRKSILTKCEGIGVIEVLVSLMVITSAVTAVILVVFSNQSLKLDNQVNNVALYRASEILERSKILGVSNFNSVVASSSTNDIFTENLSVSDISPCRKDIASSIDWSVQANRPQNVSLTTSLVSAEEAAALGEDCNIAPSSTGFQNIVCENPNAPSWDFPQDSGIPATGIDVIKRGANQYAIITSQGSANGKRDLWVVDVTNRASMKETIPPYKDKAISAIDLGPGFNDVDVAGNFAFVANNATSKQLFVVDISNLAAPDSIASVSLNAVGGGSEGQKIFYYNKKVYMGTNRMISYKEFQIFDVSNPNSPILIPNGGYDVEHNIYAIVVRDEVVAGSTKTLAYLAVSDSVGNRPKLMILDVTNPGSITLFGSYNPVPNDTLYGTALYVIGKNAYLGRQRATGSRRDLLVINISSPSLPYLSDSEQLGIGSGTDVRGMIVSGKFLFMITSDNNIGFQVWNVNNPTNINRLATCKYPQKALDMDFDGNYFYVVNRSQDALRIIYDNANPFP